MKRAVRAIVINGDKMLAIHRNKFGHKYYTLVGGGIDLGEELETALRREIQEEAGLRVGRVQHVFTEEAGDVYGTQYIYWCEYQGGEPAMSADAPETPINQMGQNLYEPVWLPLAKLPEATFLSESVKQAIIEALKNGWPHEPKSLVWQHSSVAS